MNNVRCSRQWFRPADDCFPDPPSFCRTHSAKRLPNVSALKVSAASSVLIDPFAELMIQKEFMMRGQLHHFSYQQIRDPTAACPIVTGLRHVEPDLQSLLSHPDSFPVLKFISNRIAHQSAQRLYQLPF